MNMKNDKKIRWAVLAAFLLLAGCSGPAKNDDTSEAQAAPAPGGSAADFTLPGLAGPSINLKKELASHRAVLINFWATWCPPCREEIPGLISLQKKYGGNTFTIIGIDIGETSTKVSAFAAKVGINYPVALDRDQGVAEMYKVVGIPTSYLISSEGKILGEFHAYTPDLVAAVEEATT